MNSIPFSKQYLGLGEAFYVKTRPSPVTDPAVFAYNDELAGSLGLGDMNPDDIATVFSGNIIADASEPLAMAYAGHQFGNFVPQLGDGRALLLGELADNDGTLFDIHLKGSGQTVFSRNGDGRAALGPVLREYLLSEAMQKLGVPTTRALAAVTTGEQVVRERLLPGGIITRASRSFVRVGTFQYFAARGDVDALRSLADFVIARSYPGLEQGDNKYAALLQAVLQRQARLIAQWMHIGFIHGVMNTDNMSIAGETIDYGPCAFMDHYDHAQVYSSIDRHGRYAYNNQPNIGLWNLTRFAETLLPLLDDDTDTAVAIAQDVLTGYVTSFQQYWLQGMRAKLGLTDVPGVSDEDDRALIESLLDSMAEGQVDFTLSFYHLSRLPAGDAEHDAELRSLFDDAGQIDAWLGKWRQRQALENTSDSERQAAMQAVNPVYIPRNHQVEAAIRAAEDHGDFSVFQALHAVLQQPYTWQSGKETYMLPPQPNEVVHQTFCGT